MDQENYLVCHLANDNGDPYETAAGAYFHLLKGRRCLLRHNTATMTAEELALWRTKLARIDAVLPKLRKFL